MSNPWGWAILYLALGLLMAEMSRWCARKNSSSNRDVGGGVYLIATTIWPVVICVAVAGFVRGAFRRGKR